MEKKKTNRAELESKRKLFLQLGFIITIALTIMAFEWSTEESASKELTGTFSNVFEDDMDNTYRDEEEKEIERPKPDLTITDVIKLIDDESDEDDELEFTSEADENTKIEIKAFLVDEATEDDIPFVMVENKPIFRPKINRTSESGLLDLHKYVISNVKYPKLAIEAGIQGKVYVFFVVNKKGEVTNTSIIRGIDPLIDKAALEVVRNLPIFSPGKQRNKNVNVSYTIPINFKLG